MYSFIYLGAVGHQFREEDSLLHLVPHGDLEGPDGLGPGSQQAVQDTLAGRGLDHSPTSTAGRSREELRGQPDHLAQPVQHDRLQLRAGGSRRLEGEVVQMYQELAGLFGQN